MCPRCFPLEFQLEKLKGQTVNALTFYPPDHLISRMKNKQENFPFLIFSTTSSTTKIPFQRNIDVVFFFENLILWSGRVSRRIMCVFLFVFFYGKKNRFSTLSFHVTVIYFRENIFTRSKFFHSRRLSLHLYYITICLFFFSF